MYPGYLFGPVCTCKGRYQNDPHRLGCPQYIQKPAQDLAPKIVMGKCTCGTQAVGGLCSEWCDSHKPAPPAEPTARGVGSRVYYVVSYDYSRSTVDLTDTVGGSVTMPNVKRESIQHVDRNRPVVPSSPVVFK
jgi:hypothetical protein